MSTLIALAWLAGSAPAVLPNLTVTAGRAWLGPHGEGATVVGGELDLLFVLVEPNEPIVFGTPPRRSGWLLVPFVEGVWASDVDGWRLTAGLSVAWVRPWKTMLWPIIIAGGVGYVRQWRAAGPDGISVRLQVVPTLFALLGAYARTDQMFGAGQTVEAGVMLNLLPVGALVGEWFRGPPKQEKRPAANPVAPAKP